MNALLEKLSNTALGQREIAVCRLGQHSFLLKADDRIIAFDPYLTADSDRLVPSPVKPQDFCGIDIIFGSHDHGDHIDRPALAAMAAASPEAEFIFPEAVKESISEIPHSRIIGMNDGEKLEINGITIHAVAAAHEFLDRTPDGFYPYLGYVITVNGISVYHSGDCCVYEGLLTRLLALSPEIMLLPINGRDAERLKRNCIGNMTYQEAADLAGWSGAEIVIPTHYDMFAGNLADPTLFMDFVKVKYPQMQTILLPAGEIKVIRMEN